MSKNIAILGIGILLCASSAHAQEKPRILEISNFIGQIEVKTSPNAPFTVNFEQGKAFKASQKNANITAIISIDQIDGSKINCNSSVTGKVFKIGDKKYRPEDFPKVIITMPSENGFRIKDAAIDGIVGDIGGAALKLSSCGKLQVGNIAHALELESDGATNVQTGNIGEYARINIDGAASVKTGNIKGIADVKIDGVGSLNANSANGVKLELDGTGSVKINGGKGPFDVNLDGTGSLDYDGVAINPKVRIAGVGSVKVREIIGNKDVKVEGIGKFTVK